MPKAEFDEDALAAGSKARLRAYVRDTTMRLIPNMEPVARQDPNLRASAAQMLVKIYGGRGLSTPGDQISSIPELPAMKVAATKAYLQAEPTSKVAGVPPSTTESPAALSPLLREQDPEQDEPPTRVARRLRPPRAQQVTQVRTPQAAMERRMPTATRRQPPPPPRVTNLKTIRRRGAVGVGATGVGKRVTRQGRGLQTQGGEASKYASGNTSSQQTGMSASRLSMPGQFPDDSDPNL